MSKSDYAIAGVLLFSALGYFAVNFGISGKDSPRDPEHQEAAAGKEPALSLDAQNPHAPSIPNLQKENSDPAPPGNEQFQDRNDNAEDNTSQELSRKLAESIAENVVKKIPSASKGETNSTQLQNSEASSGKPEAPALENSAGLDPQAPKDKNSQIIQSAELADKENAKLADKSDSLKAVSSAKAKNAPNSETNIFDLLGEQPGNKKNKKNAEAKKSRLADSISMTLEEKSGLVKITNNITGAASGFLTVYNKVPIVVSNLHVFGDIKDFQIYTMTGDTIPYGKLFVAEDHDIAIIPIKVIPEGCKPFELADKINTFVKTGDDVIVCGNSKGGGSMLETLGTILAVGPNVVETDCPFYRGNSGSPIFHFKTKKVVGVASHIKSEVTANIFDEASRKDSKSAIKSDFRYFGYRFDTIKKWNQISAEELIEQVELLKKSEKRLLAVVEVARLLNASKASYSITTFTDLNEAVVRFLKYKGQNPSRSRKELSEKIINCCSSEISNLKYMKLLPNLDETRQNLLESFKNIEDISRQALRI